MNETEREREMRLNRTGSGKWRRRGKGVGGVVVGGRGVREWGGGACDHIQGWTNNRRK